MTFWDSRGTWIWGDTNPVYEQTPVNWWQPAKITDPDSVPDSSWFSSPNLFFLMINSYQQDLIQNPEENII